MPEGRGEEPRPEPGERPWVHPSELPSALDGADSRRRLAVPLTAGLAGTLVVLGIGTLALGSLGTSSTAPPAGGVSLTATPTALGGVPSTDAVGALTGAVVHVKAWTGPQARYVSAIVLDRRGHAVTSADAIEGAAALEVASGTGDIHRAEIVGIDAANDLAVLRVPAAAVRHLALPTRSPSLLRTDDPCFVVGADRDGVPRSIEGSVRGVSAPLRHSDGWIIDAIEIDAPMSHRAAGSAVLTEDGRLVGVVVAPDDLGLVVVPFEEALRSLDAIAADGEMRHAWLGVRALDGPDGVVVDAVVSDGPADRAGIEPGDRLVAVGGFYVEDMDDLMRAVRRHDAGDRVRVTVERGGETVASTARLSGPPRTATMKP